MGMLKVVAGDVLGDAQEDFDGLEEGKAEWKVSLVKNEEEAKARRLSEIAMPVLGSKVSYLHSMRVVCRAWLKFVSCIWTC